ncbi:hypothetical protein [Lysinibacillus fusiformis]|uniref:hypothetical protein n=1 Tax=Lysinibacillus fusiformis TaxID=28031 RepID=UPI00301B6361
MINKKKLNDMVSKLDAMHPNDPAIESCWPQIVDEFNDEQDTIEYLNNCSEKEIYWISSVFDDLAYKFPSETYVDCIKKLAKKFPEIDMEVEIKIAESYIS